MKIGAAYIRVSTDDQMEYSPDSQIKVIQDYAKSHDIILTEEYIFREDEGISGRKAEKRPAFMQMIGMAKQKPRPFDVILIWKFSRFARSRQDSVVYKSMLRRQLGIEVQSVSEPLGDDKMAILVEALIEAMDEYYSINLGEEVRRGMTEKASRGGVVNSPPFGYIIGDNGCFIPDPDKAETVKMIFSDYLNTDIGMLGIAAKLNQLGIRTNRGNRFDNRGIAWILKNTAYIGKLRWNPTGAIQYGRASSINTDNIILREHCHEPIIDEEIFQQVQDKIMMKSKRPKYMRETKDSDHMLKGLIRCSSCGSTLVNAGKGMQCHAYSKGMCPTSHFISYKILNPAVLDAIDKCFKTGEFHLTQRKTVHPGGKADLLETQINRAKQRLERIRMAFEDGIDTIDEYRENKRRIQEELDQLEKRRTEQQPKSSIEQIHRDFVIEHQDAMKKLQDSSIEESVKNRLLKSFVDYIIFNRKTMAIDVFFYTD